MNAELVQRHTLTNRIQTLLLLCVMGGFLALLGWLLWGPGGMVWLLIPALVLFMFNPLASPELLMRLYRASPLTPEQAPALYGAVTELSRRAGLPRTPTLYYLPSRMVNAFATGSQQRAAIAITDGLLRSLDSREAIAVLAHEISHIQHNDMRVMGLADLFSRLTSTLSLFGQLLLLLNLPLLIFSNVAINWFAILILIFAPNLSALAQLGLSRTREYAADLNAAMLTGDPEGLARALIRIERQQGSFLEQIIFPGRHTPEPSLLRTHPPTEERVRRLRELQLPPGRGPLGPPVQASFLPGELLDYPVNRRPRWHISGLWH
ncbi:MAG TPA: peptidase M48 [Gammaproteobacteria bacterium]|nr:peptidase M48 [Gammaproteobacteria bacterium]